MLMNNRFPTTNSCLETQNLGKYTNTDCFHYSDDVVFAENADTTNRTNYYAVNELMSCVVPCSHDHKPLNTHRRAGTLSYNIR